MRFRLWRLGTFALSSVVDYPIFYPRCLGVCDLPCPCGPPHSRTRRWRSEEAKGQVAYKRSWGAGGARAALARSPESWVHVLHVHPLSFGEEIDSIRGSETGKGYQAFFPVPPCPPPSICCLDGGSCPEGKSLPRKKTLICPLPTALGALDVLRTGRGTSWVSPPVPFPTPSRHLVFLHLLASSPASPPSSSRPRSPRTQARLAGRREGRLAPPGSLRERFPSPGEARALLRSGPFGGLCRKDRVEGRAQLVLEARGSAGLCRPRTVRDPGDRSVRNLGFGTALRGLVEPRETESPVLRSYREKEMVLRSAALWLCGVRRTVIASGAGGAGA